MLWYSGDNGTPSHALAEAPLRGSKGTMYEGGVRVPGIIEWPARIPQPRSSRLAAHLLGRLFRPRPGSPTDGQTFRAARR